MSLRQWAGAVTSYRVDISCQLLWTPSGIINEDARHSIALIPDRTGGTPIPQEIAFPRPRDFTPRNDPRDARVGVPGDLRV